MENEVIIEAPGRGTSGLASANQLLSTTDSVSFSASNATCALPDQILPVFPSEKREKKASVQVFPPLLSRKEKFRKALEESMRKNRLILKELTRY